MPRRVDPDRIPAELELIRTLIDNDELDEAERLVNGVLIAGAKDDDAVEAYYLRGEIQLSKGEPRMALLSYEAAAAGAPGDTEVLRGHGEALFMLWQFEKARDALERSLRADKRNARAHRYLALAIDRLGKRKVAEMHFERAHRLEPDVYPLPVRIDRARFDGLVREAIASLPKEVTDRLGPIGFLVEDYPSLAMLADRPEDADPETLGVFFGEAIPARYETGGLKFVPNHIHLFQRNLEQLAESEEELEEEIRTTVYHEVGHYLGYDEEELDGLGLA